MQKTLGIIKPDAVSRNLVGSILALAEKEGLVLKGLKILRLTKRQAEGFYHVHRERSFFDDLTRFMSEGPIVVIVLAGEDAIARWRRVMGATDPIQAEEGTIRRLYGENIERNAVHGSDSPDSAAFELSYFFSRVEYV